MQTNVCWKFLQRKPNHQVCLRPNSRPRLSRDQVNIVDHYSHFVSVIISIILFYVWSFNFDSFLLWCTWIIWLSKIYVDIVDVHPTFGNWHNQPICDLFHMPSGVYVRPMSIVIIENMLIIILDLCSGMEWQQFINSCFRIWISVRWSNDTMSQRLLHTRLGIPMCSQTYTYTYMYMCTHMYICIWIFSHVCVAVAQTLTDWSHSYNFGFIL